MATRIYLCSCWVLWTAPIVNISFTVNSKESVSIFQAVGLFSEIILLLLYNHGTFFIFLTSCSLEPTVILSCTEPSLFYNIPTTILKEFHSLYRDFNTNVLAAILQSCWSELIFLNDLLIANHQSYPLHLQPLFCYTFLISIFRLCFQFAGELWWRHTGNWWIS